MSTNELLATLIAEVQALKSSQASLELKLANYGTASPSLSPSHVPGPLSALSISPPTHALPPPVAITPAALSGSSATSAPTQFSSRAHEDAESRERLRFADWIKAGAKEHHSGNASPSIGPLKKEGPWTQRVILTTYPGQTGIIPIPLNWGAQSAAVRGPVVASRHPHSLRVRNAIGAYSGSYSIYAALAAACGSVDPNFRPDYTNTEPPFDIAPNPSWFDATKIVSLDPWGHLAPQVYKTYFDSGIDVRPTISCTKAHLKITELDDGVRNGRILVDGKVVTRVPRSWSETSAVAEVVERGGEWDALSPAEKTTLIEKKVYEAGVEVSVSKAAVDPVWNLPGVAERFGIHEGILRRSLFEFTGGSLPELISRPDIKTYLPAIGGMTVYIFGDPNFVSDPSKRLTLRVHDECNGSDVFGSDICTCRPYLLYGIEQAIACAQNGGSGVVIYFRKEGRALGEVTKYLVYNARKRGGDTAATYFQRTENIAGVKDMRFQALMPDVLHWLGIKKIDLMVSMSDMKHDAIVGSGIPILERKDLPDHLIPPDSQVEIDAKIAAGYFSASKSVAKEDLIKTVGRGWEDVDH